MENDAVISSQNFKADVIIPILQTGRLRLRESKVSWLVSSTSISAYKVYSTVLFPLWGNTI